MKTYIIINILSCCILLGTKKKSNRNILFSLFILSIVLFEVFIAKWYITKEGTNKIPYCYFALSCAIIYLLTYRIKNKISRSNEFILLGIIVILTICIYLFFGDNQFIFLSKVYLLLVSIATIFGVRYLYLKLKQEFDYNNFVYDPYLYFTFGLLIFYTTSFPLLLFLETLIASGELLKTYSSILKIGNIFLSLGYLGAAICIRKEAQSTI